MSRMYRALTLIAAAVVGACAQQPAPAIRYAGDTQPLAMTEARAIELAKRHPNAQPRVRPELPEHAPPPLPPGTSLPAQLHITRRSTPHADAPAPSNVLVERAVYAESPYLSRSSYGYGYSYRRPWGFGMSVGWDPYGYGYGYGSYYPPRIRYGYGYGVGLGISAPLWGSRYLHYPSYGRVHRLGWDSPRHHHWGIGAGGRGGFGSGFGRGGFGRGGSDHVRWVSGRRR
jgi:hypothetical protein